MTFRFFVVDNGTDTEIYKIPENQTARVRNEFALTASRVNVYSDFEEAKRAALVVVKRYSDIRRDQGGLLFSKPDSGSPDLVTTIASLTEDEVEQYFL